MNPLLPSDPFDWGNIRWWFVAVIVLCGLALLWIKSEGG
jgi:hypothetical protein